MDLLGPVRQHASSPRALGTLWPALGASGLPEADRETSSSTQALKNGADVAPGMPLLQGHQGKAMINVRKGADLLAHRSWTFCGMGALSRRSSEEIKLVSGPRKGVVDKGLQLKLITGSRLGSWLCTGLVSEGPGAKSQFSGRLYEGGGTRVELARASLGSRERGEGVARTERKVSRAGEVVLAMGETRPTSPVSMAPTRLYNIWTS